MAWVCGPARTTAGSWQMCVIIIKHQQTWIRQRWTGSCFRAGKRSSPKKFVFTAAPGTLETSMEYPAHPYAVSPSLSSPSPSFGDPLALHRFSAVISSPPPVNRVLRLPRSDQAFILLAAIAVMVCGSLVALIVSTIPTLNAMRRAALSLEKLADVARKELPSTMAAIRLSGMEISDLTLELSDMSQEISDSVRSSARAVHAAEVGIRRIGSLAASQTSQTLSILQERASAPVEAVKPVVATAAENTWQAVTQAQQAVLGLTSLSVLSSWIQKKNSEEQKKIDEDMEGANGFSQAEGCSEVESQVTTTRTRDQ